ncbi:MAG: protein-glutamate O-methyltransferase CheR [Sulfuricella denitrificans]|nr:protein-glutamate O-methyltransferase CheR [Sulfuricella denitrificans]
MQLSTLTDREFGEFQGMLHRLAGIHLSPAKKALVSGRLAKRLKHYSLVNYGDYFRLLSSGNQPEELQVAVDLLTTNETYFFREPRHFDYLTEQILPERRPGVPFRVWSAACSSGEEPYTLAMVLASTLGEAPWEILASDISTRVLEKARSGLYPMERAQNIPRHLLTSYCLKGVGSQDGHFLVDKRLRGRVKFHQINLNEKLPGVGEFDVIFLRNVMIYFNLDTKTQVVARLVSMLRPGGHFIVGHSESLNGVTDALKAVRPSVYRKSGA